MSHHARSRTRPRIRGLFRVTAALLAAALAIVLLGTVLHRAASSSADADSRGGRPPADGGAATATGGGPATEADGVLPDGVSVFDERYAGVVELDPELLHAVREAATDAADAGIEFVLNSGWRSPSYQEQLLDEAVDEYGSREEAARWVAAADTSAHVSGHAVDIGSYDADLWLAEHGAAYGLCPVYDNEPWHFELLPEAIDAGCPATYRDPTQDPRMR
jgi:D-alanyl-D-alanine carboxypeptidase